MTMRVSALIGFFGLLGPALAGEIEIRPVAVSETKAVFGRVETRDVVAARARIGGTLMTISVTEGDAVKQGDRIALVADQKLALQMNAAEARIKALMSEQANAKTEYDRARDLLARGAGTQQRVDQTRTAYEVFRNQIAAAEAERSVIAQQSSEGAVLAPATGRVLTKPVTVGGVILPGEAVATIAGGGFFLRLALPERFAASLKVGTEVPVENRPGQAAAQGRIVKVFPQIENGKVIADVEVGTLGDFFVGERVLVQVPVATRQALAVPAAAVTNRSGVDFVTLAGGREVAVVTGGPVQTPEGGRIEILSGLQPGDKVMVP
jgi:RND family efflux transporter MFP subunit